MLKILAMIRQDAITRASYRMQMFVSVGSLVAALVPTYFVTQALDPFMRGRIASEGTQYFAFVLTGLVMMRLCEAVINSLPRAFGAALQTGTLEALFATPTSLVTIVCGMMAFPLLWAATEGLLMLAVGASLGVHLVVSHLLPGVVIVALILLTYLSFAIVGVALTLAFRTAGPLLTGVMIATSFLGGVYYPTHVIPSWIQKLSAFVPLTYGLRAFRQVALKGDSVGAVSSDLGILCLFLLILLPSSWQLLQFSLSQARRRGTLAHY